VEQLFNLPPLRFQNPSELMAEMLCLCPRAQENNAFFKCLFFNQLPRELLLLEADMADKQALGARADLFTPHNSKQTHNVVAAVAAVSLQEHKGEDPTVAAVRPGASSSQRGGRNGQRGSWRGKKKAEGGGGGRSGQQVSHTVSHAEQARLETGLCFSHFCYGAKANVVADTLSRPPGHVAGGASLGGELCKSALRLSACRHAGRQA
jgi:hypothetical protein